MVKIICYGCGQKLDLSELAAFTRVRCPRCQTKLTVPLPFGNFLLEEILGEGVLATVYRAMDLTLDREIVVKVLKPELARLPELPAAFMHEARAASAINHPHIVPIYSCGEMNGVPYLIMQFMPGASLSRKINNESPPLLADCAQWLLDAARGLDSAALHGMLHHDLKPSNVFLDLDGNVKVGDFGLVQALLPRHAPLVHDGETRLTLMQLQHYSPERLATGRQEVPGDVFSLGCTFYYLITGRPPFPGTTPSEVLTARQRGAHPPSTLRERVPPELNDLLMACLSATPEARPQTYTEIIITLKAVLNKLEKRAASARHAPPAAAPARPGVQDLAVKTGLTSRLRLPTASGRQPREAIAVPSPWRSPWVVGVLALVALLLLTVVALAAGRFTHARWFQWLLGVVPPTVLSSPALTAAVSVPANLFRLWMPR